MQTLREKSGEDMAYYVPPSKKVGGHGERVPHQIAPMHGVHGLTVLDNDTIEWMLNTCSEI